MAEIFNRINSPSYNRNIEPIKEVVLPEISAGDSRILEIGSGSGQHVTALAACKPDANFQPSDPDESHRKSTIAWAKHLATNNVLPPLDLDASTTIWTDAAGHEFQAGFDVILCFNVIHISPPEVTRGLVAGAARYLSPGGKLILYGPYKIDGKHTAPSNQQFDDWLKSRNPDWGVRDIARVETLSKQKGLTLQDLHRVPANNFMPVFLKQG